MLACAITLDQHGLDARHHVQITWMESLNTLATSSGRIFSKCMRAAMSCSPPPPMGVPAPGGGCKGEALRAGSKTCWRIDMAGNRQALLWLGQRAQ